MPLNLVSAVRAKTVCSQTSFTLAKKSYSIGDFRNFVWGLRWGILSFVFGAFEGSVSLVEGGCIFPATKNAPLLNFNMNIFDFFLGYNEL